MKGAVTILFIVLITLLLLIPEFRDAAQYWISNDWYVIPFLIMMIIIILILTNKKQF